LTIIPVFIYHIEKENLTKRVEVFKIGERGYKTKESVEFKEENIIDIKEEVKKENISEVENSLNSIYINIICKNIRKLHCGDR
jgi:hypothetical protein